MDALGRAARVQYRQRRVGTQAESGRHVATHVQWCAPVLAEMQLFDPPAPLQDDDEATLSIARWLNLADEIVTHEERPVDRAA